MCHRCSCETFVVLIKDAYVFWCDNVLQTRKMLTLILVGDKGTLNRVKDLKRSIASVHNTNDMSHRLHKIENHLCSKT